MSSLQAKTAIITGGGSGLGAAAARKFAAEGARLLLCDVDAERGQAVADDTGALFQQADHSDAEQCARLAAEAENLWGHLDILFNNAGIGWSGSFEACDDAALEKVYAVNVFGPWRMTRACLDLLREGAAANGKAGACLLFTASALALRARANNAPYASSKSAIIGLARSLAVELGPSGIRVNAICPGLVDTPASRRFTSGWSGRRSEEVFAAYRTQTPLGRLAEAEDIANTAAFLASDAGRAISAAALVVDGGTAGL